MPAFPPRKIHFPVPSTVTTCAYPIVCDKPFGLNRLITTSAEAETDKDKAVNEVTIRLIAEPIAHLAQKERIDQTTPTRRP
jgi:hypothetical protein